MKIEENDLINDWIELQTLDQYSEDTEKYIWASDELNLLALRSPKHCFDICMKILNKTDDDWVLTNLAAGPIETLLSIHPNETIVFIRNETEVNERLARVLHHVWQNIIPEEIWKEIKEISN